MSDFASVTSLPPPPDTISSHDQSETTSLRITKIGSVTVAHSKISSDDEKIVSSDNVLQSTTTTSTTSFDYMCQPCDNITPTTIYLQNNSDSDDEKEKVFVPPVQRIITPRDVTQINNDDDIIYIVGTQGNKVTRLSHLEDLTELKDLICRSCLIGTMEGLGENLSTLRKLELYDNHIEKFANLHHLQNLVILDMSYNSIRDMKPVEVCINLEELYLAQNKLRRIQGLEGMTKLRTLDLGANRIRVLDCVAGLTSLKSLWLGKNKIEEVPDLSALQNMRQLDIQSNRLNHLGGGLLNLSKLEELYLACNNLRSLEGLPRCDNSDTEGSLSSPALHTLDVTTNKIKSVELVTHLQALEEFWMSRNLVESVEDLLPLQSLPALTCLYLEHSPIQVTLKDSYRKDILEVLPGLTQLDATMVSKGKGL